MEVLLGKEADSISFNSCLVTITCSLVRVTPQVRPNPPALLRAAPAAARNRDVFDTLSFQMLQKLIEGEKVELRD